jgi:hypothetical protein
MLTATRFLVVVMTILLAAGSSALFAEEPPSRVAAGVQVAAVKASVTGTVRVAGNRQRPPPLSVFKNRSFCGAQVPNETLLIGPDGGLRNAVLTVHPLDNKVAAQPMKLILDNQRCAFAPHVQVATLGSDLLLKNSDPILHTVHARLGKETLFNVGLPIWRQVTKRLDRAGVIKIDCDVLHTWMSAVIIVTRTPYFAVSDEHGKFIIDRLPAGPYRVEIWHEKLGTRSMRVTVAGDLSLDIVYALNGNPLDSY